MNTLLQEQNLPRFCPQKVRPNKQSLWNTEIQNQRTKTNAFLSANEAPSEREIAKATLSRTASQRTKYSGISLTEEVKDTERAIEHYGSWLCCDKILRL